MIKKLDSSMEENTYFEERLVLLCLEKASARFTSIDFNNEYHKESFKKDFNNMLNLCRETISEVNID